VTKYKGIGVYVTPDDGKRLKELARSKRISLSALVRLAINKFLESKKLIRLQGVTKRYTLRKL